SLAGGPANKLPVDAPRLVSFGADDVQTPRLLNVPAFFEDFLLFLHLMHGRAPDVDRHVETAGEFAPEAVPGHEFGIAAQQDIGAAPGHVGGNGDGPAPPGLGDNFRLAPV